MLFHYDCLISVEHEQLHKARMTVMKLTFVTQKSEMRKVETTMKSVNSSLCLWRNLNSSISPVITDSMPPIYNRRQRS